MPWWFADSLTILLALALLFLGGEWLVRGASELARRLGVSELVIGLTIVAFGTSAPELVVSVDAALGGSDAIALGNVIGSNVANIALILGACALLRPLRVELELIRRDAPLMIVASLLLVFFLWDGGLARWEAALLSAGLVLYLLLLFRQSRVPAQASEHLAPAPLPAALLRLGLGLGALLVGAPLLVGSASEIATRLGVSEALIGLTLVAVGTSLPELATSLAAARRGNGDIAIGNIVGSNLFNVLGILGVAGLCSPLQRAGISAVSLGVMLAFAALLWPLIRSGHRLSRGEGVALLSAYAGYIVWLSREG